MYSFTSLTQQNDLFALLSSTATRTSTSSVNDGRIRNEVTNGLTSCGDHNNIHVDHNVSGCSNSSSDMFNFQQHQSYGNNDNNNNNDNSTLVFSTTPVTRQSSPNVTDIPTTISHTYINQQRKDQHELVSMSPRTTTLINSATESNSNEQQHSIESSVLAQQEQSFYSKPNDNPYYYWPPSQEQQQQQSLPTNYSHSTTTAGGIEDTGITCLDSDYNNATKSNNEDLLTLQLLHQQQQAAQQSTQQAPLPNMYQTDDGSHSSNSSVQTHSALEYEDLFRRRSFDTTTEQSLMVAQPPPPPSQPPQTPFPDNSFQHYHQQHRGSLPNVYIPGMTQSVSWNDHYNYNNSNNNNNSIANNNKKRPPSSSKQQRSKRRLVNDIPASTPKPIDGRSRSVDFSTFSKEWFDMVDHDYSFDNNNHSNSDNEIHEVIQQHQLSPGLMAHHQERKRSRRQQYHDPGSNIIVEPTRTEQQIIHDNDSNNNNTNNNHGIIEEDTEEEVFPEINDVDWDTARHNPTAVPRRQKLRYGGDEYTPKWVRYTGQAKEGYCDSCKPGKWLQLKNSAYWYHKQFFHGISSVSGKRFMEPLKQRAGDHDVVEGLCHQCHQFVPICNAKRKTSVLWYRHAHKCHIYDKPKSTAVSKRNNSLSNSKKFFT